MWSRNLNTSRLVRNLLCTLAITGLAIGVLACSAPPSKELQRVPSPNGPLDAVLVLRHNPSFVPDLYQIYIVRHGETPTKKGLVLNADKVIDPRLVWKGARLLEFFYSQAHIVLLRNAMESPISGEQPIEIRLMPPGDRLAIPDTW